MKVKTIVSGLANGLESAFDHLDSEVNVLHPNEIVSITDTHLVDNELSDKINYYPGPCIVRVVVYK